jgi:metal-sulfur cluster biosynthetic enzyme
MNPTENEIRDVLKTVIDPELCMNIIDLGLVYHLEYDDHSIRVTMTLTTPGCPMHDSMPSWVRESLARTYNGLDIQVNVVWDPPWTPALISKEAKSQLGRF